MPSLVAATAFFVLTHLVFPRTPAREALVRRLGRIRYAVAYSLLSAAALAWMAWGYAEARSGPSYVVLWGTSGVARGLNAALQALAMLLIVPGLATRNPASALQEGALHRTDVVSGMLRITRHPFLWGVVAWAAGHLLANGEAPSVLLFGVFLGLALLGTVTIDAKRRRALGGKWDAFAARTSSLPFLAIVQGRQRLVLAEIGWWRLLLAVAAWALLAWGHPFLVGAPAFP